MKLTKGTFLREWERIGRRFGKKPDSSNLADAEDYYAFLSSRMTAEDFVVAAQSVWASSRFFPAPAEFLTVRGAEEWRTVLAMAQWGYNKATWDALTPGVRNATDALGGLTGIGGSRDVLRMRNAWMDCYEREAHGVHGVLSDAVEILQIGGGTDESE